MLLAYLGHDRRLYLQYADAAAGRTLEAAPGGTYDVRAREPGLPLPPGDGRWGPASPPPLTALERDPDPADPAPSALPALPGDGGPAATDPKE